MRPDVGSARDRVSAVRARLARPGARSTPEEVEDALSEGYAQALAGDAWLGACERRLRELIDEAAVRFRGPEVQALAREHARFQRQVIELRLELEALRRDHESPRATAP